MDEQNIRHVLSTLGIPHNKATFTGSVSRTRWMTISCPFAPWTHSKKTDNNPSFGITINETGRSSFKCLSCGIKGRFSALPTRLGGYRKKDYAKLRQWAEIAEFNASAFRPIPKWDEADPVSIDHSTPAPEIRKASGKLSSFPLALGSRYLRKRGLTFQDILRMNIRYDAWQRRVLFPVYDHSNVFRGFTGRSVIPGNNTTNGNNPKVKDYFGLNKRELFLKLPGMHDGPKIVCEGLFDYATLVRFGYHNARAILGTALTDEKLAILLDEAEPVYFLMDNDLAGWQALFGIFKPDGGLDTQNAWAFRLYKEIPVWIVPYRTHLAGEDPGSITDRNELENMLRRAWLFTGKAPMTKDRKPTMQRPKII